jgi:hypothetical protein
MGIKNKTEIDSLGSIVVLFVIPDDIFTTLHLLANITQHHHLFLQVHLPPCPKYFQPRHKAPLALRLHNRRDANNLLPTDQ